MVNRRTLCLRTRRINQLLMLAMLLSRIRTLSPLREKQQEEGQRINQIKTWSKMLTLMMKKVSQKMNNLNLYR